MAGWKNMRQGQSLLCPTINYFLLGQVLPKVLAGCRDGRQSPVRSSHFFVVLCDFFATLPQSFLTRSYCYCYCCVVDRIKVFQLSAMPYFGLFAEANPHTHPHTHTNTWPNRKDSHTVAGSYMRGIAACIMRRLKASPALPSQFTLQSTPTHVLTQTPTATSTPTLTA